MRSVLGALALAALSCHACHPRATTATSSPGEAGVERGDGSAPAAPPDPLVEDLWKNAADGDLADLARLRDREGDLGLVERAADPRFRATAIAALGCGDDFTALPFLADVATHGTDAEAEAALESALAVAAVPRRARDPEDALELGQGCDALLALARAADAPRARRSRAVSLLRMLQEAGCLRGEALPPDLDAK